MAESSQNRYFRKQLEKRLGKSVIGIGQVVSEDFEVAQRQQGKFTSYKEQASGVLLNRYKVRICSATDESDSVDDLIIAYGQAPTSGLRGESCPTPAYPVNTYVTIFQDPLTELYYIEHAHPNSKIELLKTKEVEGCGAASGFEPGSINFKVPQSCINPEGSGVAAGSEVPRNTVPSQEDKKQDSHNESVILPSPCIPVDTAAVNKELEGLVKFVSELKTGVLGEDSFLQTSQEFISKVDEKISQAADAIANSITWLINEIRRRVMRKVNGIVNDTIGNLYLSARYSVLEAKDNALDLISCLFLKILSKLADLIADFLRKLIDEFLTTGLCIIESFLSSLLGSILPSLLDAINSILGPISSLIGSAISLANDIISFVEGIIDFLSCDITQLCPVTNEWNFLEGGIDSSEFSLSSLDFNSVFESAKSFADSAIALGNIPGDVVDSLSGINAQQAVQNAIDSASGCVSLFKCGVPRVSFWGSDGSGATGNAVIGVAGEILGVNIITPGSGYSTPPSVSFIDPCGRGKGAYGRVKIGKYKDADGKEQVGVTSVVMVDSGYGYLPSEDGTVGGNGRTVGVATTALVTTTTTSTTTSTSSVVGVATTSTATTTTGTTGVTTTTTDTSTISVGITTAVISTVFGTTVPDTSSTTSSSTYPVAVSIGGVSIIDPGFGFADGDTITVTPENGAELVPVIGGNGRIIDINIINPGIGFTSMPTLKLNTRTGYNATLIPILSFNRIREGDAFDVPAGAQLVQVVDCVGKN